MATELKTQRENGWLYCQLDQGMFSDEVAVTYPSTGTWKKSVFVPEHLVEGEIGSRGKVRVRLLRGDGKLLAVLPNSQHDIVEVTESDIAAD